MAVPYTQTPGLMRGGGPRVIGDYLAGGQLIGKMFGKLLGFEDAKKRERREELKRLLVKDGRNALDNARIIELGGSKMLDGVLSAERHGVNLKVARAKLANVLKKLQQTNQEINLKAQWQEVADEWVQTQKPGLLAKMQVLDPDGTLDLVETQEILRKRGADVAKSMDVDLDLTSRIVQSLAAAPQATRMGLFMDVWKRLANDRNFPRERANMIGQTILQSLTDPETREFATKEMLSQFTLATATAKELGERADTERAAKKQYMDAAEAYRKAAEGMQETDPEGAQEYYQKFNEMMRKAGMAPGPGTLTGDPGDIAAPSAGRMRQALGGQPTPEAEPDPEMGAMPPGPEPMPAPGPGPAPGPAGQPVTTGGIQREHMEGLQEGAHAGSQLGREAAQVFGGEPPPAEPAAAPPAAPAPAQPPRPGTTGQFRELADRAVKETDSVSYGELSNLVTETVRQLNEQGQDAVSGRLNEVWEAVQGHWQETGLQDVTVQEMLEAYKDIGNKATAPYRKAIKGLVSFIRGAAVGKPKPTMLETVMRNLRAGAPLQLRGEMIKPAEPPAWASQMMQETPTVPAGKPQYFSEKQGFVVINDQQYTVAGVSHAKKRRIIHALRRYRNVFEFRPEDGRIAIYTANGKPMVRYGKQIFLTPEK